MTKDNIKSIILNMLRKKQSIGEVKNIEELNYFEQGIIDSISLIKFVIDIEDAFNIDIESNDIANNRFKTVGGLIGLIHSKINAK